MKKVSSFRVLLLPLVRDAGSSPQQAQVDGYMSQDSTGIYWVEWTENNGQFTGTYGSCALNALMHTYDGASLATGWHNYWERSLPQDAYGSSLGTLPRLGQQFQKAMAGPGSPLGSKCCSLFF